MAIKKTELYSKLWASCDALRGGMDATQYKDYVLTLLFLKYVSDKAKANPRAIIQVPEEASFDYIYQLKGDKEIGDKINKALASLAKMNGLERIIDVADFNNEDQLGKGKVLIERLGKLLDIFQGINMEGNRADGDDLLGDAYEYLMRHFATESGKSKGQFYTPSEVSRILAKIIGITPDTTKSMTVYDPTCGSGSLLIKVADEAPNGLTIYGQEMDNATRALARMNTILHSFDGAEIHQDNTLASPKWTDENGNLKAFDYVVANPPFSYKAWNTGLVPAQDLYRRFEYGIPPEKNGDFAFLLHILKSMKSTGKGAAILPHGVLFRGNVEGDIRRNLIKQGYIKGIIGLPANLFYGTGIPACILVLDKESAKGREGIFMMDASKGFVKDGNKNRLREQDIHKIVDVFNAQIPVKRFARMVPMAEIEKNEFNLNIPRYIDGSEPEDLHDLFAHLNGGIPDADLDALDKYWQVFPSLRGKLFEPHQNPGYSQALVTDMDVKPAILENPEFQKFKAECLGLFEQWKSLHKSTLSNIAVGDKPRELISLLAEDLLERFEQAPLLDNYDIYQILMAYWAETMQDDVYLIAQDGWKIGNVVRQLVPVKNAKGKDEYMEEADFEFGKAKNKQKYKSDLIPPDLVIRAFMKPEKSKLDALQADLDKASQALESYTEEHATDEGLLAEARNDKGNISAKTLKDRLKVATDEDEKEALKYCLLLVNEESNLKKQVKLASEELEQEVFRTIPLIPEEDIKKLVIKDKWLARLEAGIEAEIERVTQTLADRIKTLETRYEDTLPDLTDNLKDLSAKVDGHLQKMGLTW